MSWSHKESVRTEQLNNNHLGGYLDKPCLIFLRETITVITIWTYSPKQGPVIRKAVHCHKEVMALSLQFSLWELGCQLWMHSFFFFNGVKETSRLICPQFKITKLRTANYRKFM